MIQMKNQATSKIRQRHKCSLLRFHRQHLGKGKTSEWVLLQEQVFNSLHTLLIGMLLWVKDKCHMEQECQQQYLNPMDINLVDPYLL